jgi:hypothetical protein
MSRNCMKMRPSASTAFPQSTTVAKEAGGRHGLRPPVDYGRSGRPDLGVWRSRFEPLAHLLGLVVEELFIGFSDV